MNKAIKIMLVLLIIYLLIGVYFWYLAGKPMDKIYYIIIWGRAGFLAFVEVFIKGTGTEPPQ